MAKITRGISFSDGEQVTPTKLNNLINTATLGNVSASDLGVNVRTFFYGSSAPPISQGTIWYDTTPGSEGLKYAFISPSSGSVAGYCYLMPRREAYFWTESAVSAGMPLIVARTSFAISGLHAKVYDGLALPSVWYYSAHTGGSWAYPYVVVSMESVAVAGNPVKCAWAGLIPAWTGGSDVTAANMFLVNIENNNLSFQNAASGAVPQRQMVIGTVLHNTSNPTFSAPNFLLWGTGCVHEDIV